MFGGVQDKNAALKAAGAIVPESFEGFEGIIKQTYDQLVQDGQIVPQPEPEVKTVPLDLEAAKKAGKVPPTAYYIWAAGKQSRIFFVYIVYIFCQKVNPVYYNPLFTSRQKGRKTYAIRKGRTRIMQHQNSTVYLPISESSQLTEALTEPVLAGPTFNT